MTKLQDIIKSYNDCGIGIRAILVTEKATKGTVSHAFGHVLIHPEDFDALDDKTCKYEIIDERDNDRLK